MAVALFFWALFFVLISVRTVLLLLLLLLIGLVVFKFRLLQLVYRQSVGATTMDPALDPLLLNLYPVVLFCIPRLTPSLTPSISFAVASSLFRSSLLIKAYQVHRVNSQGSLSGNLFPPPSLPLPSSFLTIVVHPSRPIKQSQRGVGAGRYNGAAAFDGAGPGAGADF